LAGAELSTQMIVFGTQVNAKKTLENGIIDCIYKGEDDFFDAAINYTQKLLATKAPERAIQCIEAACKSRHQS